MQDEQTQCKRCGKTVDTLDIFPGGICLCCHAKKFDAEVARNGGILPRPDFSGIFAKRQKARR
jgi:hypothetical protein